MKVYETILSTPGMNDKVKLDLKVSRQQILLLAQLINTGIERKESDKDGLLATVTNETLTDMRALATECLQKAGLVELNEKLVGLRMKV